MTLATPTLKELNTAILADLELGLGQDVPLLPKAFLRVLAKVLAAVALLTYKYTGYAHLQMFVSTADYGEVSINGVAIRPLIEWGRLIGVGEPTTATRARLGVTLDVTMQTGSLPAGSTFINSQGIVYSLENAVALDAASVTGVLVAVGDQSTGDGSGTVGNMNVNDTIDLATTDARIERTATVTSVVQTAADEESEKAYRSRVLDRYQNRPQGGSSIDYRQWSEEVEGIIRAYPYTSTCPGEVNIYVEATEASSGSADGIPTTEQLQQVSDSIELPKNGLSSRRPIGSLVRVKPITRATVDITIDGLTTEGDLVKLRTEVINALAENLKGREPTVGGIYSQVDRNVISTGKLSCVVNDVAEAVNGAFEDIKVWVKGTQTPLYYLGEGEKAKLGTVTWV